MKFLLIIHYSLLITSVDDEKAKLYMTLYMKKKKLIEEIK